MTDPTTPRSILVVAHARRDDTVAAARRVIAALIAADARPVLAVDDPQLVDALSDLGPLAALGADVAVTDIELAVVLGGDGTILRAAELVRDGAAPILGINMGHVGFLAEIDPDDIDDAMRRIIACDYQVEERMTLSVRVKDAGGDVIYETWALNEATVEKAARERMMEVVMEIDRRPLSSFGLRRCRDRDPDRVHGLQLLRRRPGDLAHRRRDRRRSAVGSRVVRAPAGGGTGGHCCDRGARAHGRHGNHVVRRQTLSRPAARGSCRRAQVLAARAPCAPASGSVHRPAGAEVPAAGDRMARSR